MRPEDVWEINQWCTGTDTRPPEVVAEIERERALERDQYRALRRVHFRFGQRTAAVPENETVREGGMAGGAACPLVR